jgi:hypothetical protein
MCSLGLEDYQIICVGHWSEIWCVGLTYLGVPEIPNASNIGLQYYYNTFGDYLEDQKKYEMRGRETGMDCATS